MADLLNEQKDKLLLLRENYKQMLLEEVKDIKTDFIKTKNWILLAGSAIIVGYVVVKLVSTIFTSIGTKEEKIREVIIEKPYQVYDTRTVEKESFLSPILKAIKQEVRLFLLGLAKQALRDFISSLQQKEKK